MCLNYTFEWNYPNFRWAEESEHVSDGCFLLARIDFILLKQYKALKQILVLALAAFVAGKVKSIRNQRAVYDRKEGWDERKMSPYNNL